VVRATGISAEVEPAAALAALAVPEASGAFDSAPARIQEPPASNRASRKDARKGVNRREPVIPAGASCFVAEGVEGVCWTTSSNSSIRAARSLLGSKLRPEPSFRRRVGAAVIPLSPIAPKRVSDKSIYFQELKVSAVARMRRLLAKR
jgi:hypothetical protein